MESSHTSYTLSPLLFTPCISIVYVSQLMNQNNTLLLTKSVLCSDFATFSLKSVFWFSISARLPHHIFLSCLLLTIPVSWTFLTFGDLTVLRSIGWLFYKMSINIDFSDIFFLMTSLGVYSFERNIIKVKFHFIT